MRKRRGTNLPRMGDFNRSVILEAIRRAPSGSSRIELVAATGLSAQTVTNITRRLLDEGLIVETGRTIRGPGKPRVTLQVVPGGRFAVGVHLDPAVITFILLNMAGSVVHRRVVRTDLSDPQRVVDLMASAVEELIHEARVDRALVAGVGVAAPGPIDAARGALRHPPKLLGWHDVELRDLLAERSGLPVTLEKDTTAAAVGELWTGDGSPDGSFVFLYLGTGVGAALARNGEIVRGATHNFGEVGHIIVDPDGAECGCGARGCVAVVCTPQAIVDAGVRAGVLVDDGASGEVVTVEGRLAELSAKASAGEGAALEVLRGAAGHLSVLIAVMTNLLDVDRVVLGGPNWTRLAEVYLEEIPRQLERRSTARGGKPTVVSGTVVGGDGGAVGAACVVLDAALAPRASNLYLQD